MRIGAVALAALLAGCPSARPAPAASPTPEAPMQPPADPSPRIRAALDLPDDALAGAAPWIAELAADWLREAGTSDVAADVIDILTEELADAAAPLSAPDRLDLLRSAVVERRARRLSVSAFALGKRAVVAYEGGDTSEVDAVRAEAAALLAAHAALRDEAATVRHPGFTDEIRRHLHDGLLDLTYAATGEIRSPQLDRWAMDPARGR
jgi:hypothetical protein